MKIKYGKNTNPLLCLNATDKKKEMRERERMKERKNKMKEDRGKNYFNNTNKHFESPFISH